MRKISIYIHIPFCVRKCSYCDFVSYEDFSNMDMYVDSLIKEIVLYSKQNAIVDTIYIGGGTPSLLSKEHLDSIIGAIYKNYSCNIEEFTIECNPDSITEDKLSYYKELGINRISIGVQSLDDDLLSIIGRVHNTEQAIKSIELAKKYFDNINVDLMIGLPRENDEEAISTLHCILQYNIPHISLYSLILEDNTPLKSSVISNDTILPSEDDVVDRFNKMSLILENYGLKRYEVSNFAIEGKECIHNIGYWRLKEYIGIGINSSGYLNGIRYSNVISINEYINLLDNNIKPLSKSELISQDESEQEYIMLTLRTRQGILLEEYKRLYYIDFIEKYRDEIDHLIDYLNINDNTISVKPDFFGILNSIILHFLT